MLQSKYRTIRMRLGLSVSAAILLSVASSIPTAAAQEVGDVAWRFQAGDRFEFSALDQIKTIAIQSGQSFEIPQERTVEATWLVKSVDAQGAATIEMTLGRVKLQIRSPFAGQIILDSEEIDAGAAEEIQTVQEMYQQFVGQKLLFVMDKQGTINDLNWAEPYRFDEEDHSFKWQTNVRTLHNRFKKCWCFRRRSVCLSHRYGIKDLGDHCSG